MFVRSNVIDVLNKTASVMRFVPKAAAGAATAEAVVLREAT